MAVGEMMVLHLGWPGRRGQEVAHGAIASRLTSHVGPHRKRRESSDTFRPLGGSPLLQGLLGFAIGNGKEISLLRQLHVWIFRWVINQRGDVSLPRHSIHSTADG
jgi:hypothetical protein